MTWRTRFAPSPSGSMHLGHAFAAIVAHDMALARGGEFLVRIEDIDRGRCRREHEEGIFVDLAWLGLSWSKDVRRQSDCQPDYDDALASLAERDLIYPCFCTRKEIAAEIATAQSAPHGPDGPLYPGSCKRLSRSERDDRLARGTAHALRLDSEAAIESVGEPLFFYEEGCGDGEGATGHILAEPATLGDVVLARKDVRTSYHLAVTVDDALQSIDCVTRGSDLFFATHIHRLLQALLDLPTPGYHHHGLIRGSDGKRLATRDKATSLAALRGMGTTPAEIRDRLGLADTMS